MLIRIADFKGQIPRLHPRLIPTNFAQVAKNTRLEDGAIGPVNAPVIAHTFAQAPLTFIRHEGQFVGFSQPNVNATVGPVAQNRLYFTGDGFPKMRVGATDYTLGINPPNTAPQITVTPPATPPETDGAAFQEVVAYVYTYVSSFGEESAPSPASALTTIGPGDQIAVTVYAPVQTGRALTKIRIYRSKTSLAGVTDFYYLTEVNAVSQTVQDTQTAILNETLPSRDYDPPEADMLGLIAMPNGMMAAHRGREVLFCQPFQPHAWPVKYRLTTDSEIVGLGAFGSYVAVMTKGAPYLIQGSEPDLMVMEKLEQTIPCVSRHSIVDMGYSVAFASFEGLVVISQNGANVVSRSLFTEEQWRRMRPETIRAAQINGRYCFSYEPTAGSTARKFGIIDIGGEQPFFVEADIAPTAMHYAGDLGALYYVEGGATVRQWDPKSGTVAMRQTWRSKRVVLPGHHNFGAFLVEADPVDGTKQTPGDPDCVIRFYADGELIHTSNKINAPGRLPGGFLADRWEVEVEGYVTVTAISIATDISDLAEG